MRRLCTTGSPIVRLGTKWPSITSTCSQSAFSTASASSPSWAKSADRMLGAISGSPEPGRVTSRSLRPAPQAQPHQNAVAISAYSATSVSPSSQVDSPSKTMITVRMTDDSQHRDEQRREHQGQRSRRRPGCCEHEHRREHQGDLQRALQDHRQRVRPPRCGAASWMPTTFSTALPAIATITSPAKASLMPDGPWPAVSARRTSPRRTRPPHAGARQHADRERDRPSRAPWLVGRPPAPRVACAAMKRQRQREQRQQQTETITEKGFSCRGRGRVQRSGSATGRPAPPPTARIRTTIVRARSEPSCWVPCFDARRRRRPGRAPAAGWPGSSRPAPRGRRPPARP